MPEEFLIEYGLYTENEGFHAVKGKGTAESMARNMKEANYGGEDVRVVWRAVSVWKEMADLDV